MARQPSFEAVAGANTLNRVEDDVVAMNRYRDDMIRQEAATQRAEVREDRIAKSMALDDEVKRWKFEKEKTLDANAKLLQIDLDKEAIEANLALREIRADDPDAPQKLSDWGVKYFRQLDENVGDKRLQKQYGINQTLVNTIALERGRAQRESEAARAAQAAAAAEGKVLTDITTKEGGVTRKFEAPGSKSPTDTARLTDINKRLKTEFGVDLDDVNNPSANMRRVNPKEDGTIDKNGKSGDPQGSHYAFNVKRGSRDETILIPVDRFRVYADEYATAKSATAPAVAPASISVPAATSVVPVAVEPAVVPAPGVTLGNIQVGNPSGVKPAGPAVEIVPTATAPAATSAPSATPAPVTSSKTVWKVDKNGIKWEFDVETKKPTGKYVKGA